MCHVPESGRSLEAARRNAMAMTAAVEHVQPDEATLRRDLAAAYRLVALFGWDDLIATHISVRLPDGNGFLINPFGMLFDEIRPADLVKVDMNGNVLSPTNWGVNLAGFVIHSAIHAARDDAHCVMHLHTSDGIAVSMLEEGLLPLNQTAMLVAGDIAFHEYEGIALDLDERERLAADLGDKDLMILRNHGTLSLGGTVAEAFTNMYFLETACTAQVRALGMGRPLHQPSRQSIDKVAASRAGPMAPLADGLIWPAMLRKLDRVDPGWRD
jgi:ribulose-5-phosphate 4-epimerase/fuculose-1-phosphate aldolase